MAEPPPTAIRPSQPWVLYTARQCTAASVGLAGVWSNTATGRPTSASRVLQHARSLHAGVGDNKRAGDAGAFALLLEQPDGSIVELDLGEIVDECHGLLGSLGRGMRLAFTIAANTLNPETSMTKFPACSLALAVAFVTNAHAACLTDAQATDLVAHYLAPAGSQP